MGQLVLEDLSSPDHELLLVDFSSTDARVEKAGKPQDGILSPDGKWRMFFIEEEDTNEDGVIDWEDRASVYLVSVGSTERKRVPLPFPVVGSCDWGPGDRIAACAFASSDVLQNENNSSGGNSIVYLVNLDSGKLVLRLSDPAKWSWNIRWSPDRGMVAFKTGTMRDADILDTEAIHVVDPQTGELVYAFEDREALIGDYAWSPDSTAIAFVASLAYGEYSKATIKGMYNDVFYVSLNDGSHTATNITRTSRFSQIPSSLTEKGGIAVGSPVWSPDAKSVASVWRQYNRQEIWITSVDGDGWAKVTGGPDHQYRLIEWRP